MRVNELFHQHFALMVRKKKGWYTIPNIFNIADKIGHEQTIFSPILSYHEGRKGTP